MAPPPRAGVNFGDCWERKQAGLLVFGRRDCNASKQEFLAHERAIIAGLSEIADRYDVLLCDVWGVVHNGRESFRDACEALVRFRAERGPVILITNAPRPQAPILEQLDSLGVPRVVVDWRIHDGDFAGVLASVADLGRQMAAAGLGRLRKVNFAVPEPGRALSTGMHHVGTTRMARDESEGVVDTQCRVFGTDDLYVAGSSVFPTSGAANPTLTIVALALRLAAHLKERLG